MLHGVNSIQYFTFLEMENTEATLEKSSPEQMIKLAEHFGSIKMIPANPIMATYTKYMNDTDPKKVNLGMGAYRDDAGKSHVFDVVKKVEEQILKEQLDKVDIQIHLGIQHGGTAWCHCWEPSFNIRQRFACFKGRPCSHDAEFVGDRSSPCGLLAHQERFTPSNLHSDSNLGHSPWDD